MYLEVSRTWGETSLFRGSILFLPRRRYRILHRTHFVGPEYQVTTRVTGIMVQGCILISTTTADCVRIIDQGKITRPRRLRSAKVLPTHCHRQPLPMDLQDESETAKASQLSDLNEETLRCHWTGTMIYTLALQSVSFAGPHYHPSLQAEEDPILLRYRTLNDGLTCRP
jgi:hypothetical protein